MNTPVDQPIYQCTPNFSEGRRAEVVAAIADAIRTTPGAVLADYSADVDHNRCVMTILGGEEAIRQAVLAAARVAVARIDLRTHTGVHPRAGAIDVLPITPIRDATREQAVALAAQIGRDLTAELDLPIYFYEWNARPLHSSALPDLRRGGFEAFARSPLSGDRAPDLGPNHVHPSAGVVIVGARGPLIAYNVNLSTPDVSVAQRIARRIRHEREVRPELRGVRALGLFLASRNQAQVSLNLTRPAETPLPPLFTTIRHEAATFGVTALESEKFESEIIGLIPTAALDGQPPAALHWHTYKPTQLLEYWTKEPE